MVMMADGWRAIRSDEGWRVVLIIGILAMGTKSYLLALDCHSDTFPL
jgi:hypothetical protein